MDVFINDLSFCYILPNEDLAMQTVEEFIKVCKMLESTRCHYIDRILSSGVDKNKELYPTGNLYCIINRLKDIDKRRYFLSLLTNRTEISNSHEQAFIYQGLRSYTCFLAKDDMIASIKTTQDFEKAEIRGLISGKTISIRNVSQEEHVYLYRELVGLRIYVANKEKHKKKGYNFYGSSKPGSPMDLTDEEAQILLDKAIFINGRLYGRKNNKNYAFMSSGNCEYHGYIADNLKENIIRMLDRIKWN